MLSVLTAFMICKRSVEKVLIRNFFVCVIVVQCKVDFVNCQATSVYIMLRNMYFSVTHLEKQCDILL